MSVTAADFTKLDPYWTERLPYNFAKRHGVIAALLDNGVEVWTRPEITSAILVEVQRALGQPVQPQPLSAGDFEVRSTALRSGKGDALNIVDDLGGHFDLGELALNLPRVADLLDSEDDAPIVRLINALLGQRCARAHRTFTSSRSRAARWCASASTACCATCSNRRRPRMV